MSYILLLLQYVAYHILITGLWPNSHIWRWRGWWWSSYSEKASKPVTTVWDCVSTFYGVPMSLYLIPQDIIDEKSGHPRCVFCWPKHIFQAKKWSLLPLAKLIPSVIAYVAGTSEKLRKMFHKNLMLVHFKPTNTLRQKLVHPRHKTLRLSDSSKSFLWRQHWKTSWPEKTDVWKRSKRIHQYQTGTALFKQRRLPTTLIITHLQCSTEFSPQTA